MKTKKIIKRIDKAIKKERSLNLYLKHDDVYYNIIPIERSDKLVIAVHVLDFCADGFIIFPIMQADTAYIKGTFYDEIAKKEGVKYDVGSPISDISDIKAVCRHFEKSGEIISVEVPGFYLGRIARTKKNTFIFEWFDAEGVWQEPVKLRYEDIALITYKGRYQEIYSKYVD